MPESSSQELKWERLSWSPKAEQQLHRARATNFCRNARPRPIGWLIKIRTRLEGEKLGSPAFGCDARPLGCNRVGGLQRELPHDLPTDGRVRIEEPFKVRGRGA
jgi:hypothetical protein